jgi:hypothetical protein
MYKFSLTWFVKQFQRTLKLCDSLRTKGERVLIQEMDYKIDGSKVTAGQRV